MKYREGYKYQLATPHTEQTCIFPPVYIATDFVILSTTGVLLIKEGYAWDGCSGPTIDTTTTMRGGLVHDCLYQLMRCRMLDVGWRETVDQEFRRILQLSGMGWFRAWYYYSAVRYFGESSAKWQDDKILEAP